MLTFSQLFFFRIIERTYKDNNKKKKKKKIPKKYAQQKHRTHKS